MGGVDVGGVYTDEFGIPHISDPKYYTDFVYPKGVGINLNLPLPDKPAIVADLANVMLQQEMIFNPTMSAADQQKRLADITATLEMDYLDKPIMQQSDPRETFEGRRPGTVLLGQGVEPAPAANLPKPAGYEVSLETAMRPQAMAARGQQELIGELNWANIQQTLQQQMQLNDVEAEGQTEGLKAAYEAIARDSQDLTPQEILAKAIEEIQGISNAETIGELDPRFQKQGPSDPYVQAWARQTYGGNEYPYLNEVQSAYVKGSLGYAKSKREQEIKNEKASYDYYNVATDASGTRFIEVPKIILDYLLQSNPKTTPPVFDPATDAAIRQYGSLSTGVVGKKPFPKMMNQIAMVQSISEVGDPNAWYLDPTMRDQILSNPEEYISEGFFTDQSYTGKQSETNKMWALRSLIAPLNIVAGAAQEYILEPTAIATFGLGMEIADTLGEGVDYVLGTDLSTSEDINYLSAESFAQPSEARKETRRQQTPLYEDHPVLANVAFGKGLTGEMGDLADGLGIEGWGKFGMQAAGFAGDILDPTFGVIQGGGAATKTALNLQKANKSLLTAKSAKEIMEISAKAGVGEFMRDFNGISYALRPMSEKLAKDVAEGKATNVLARTGAYIDEAYKMPYGDIRLHLSDDLIRQMDVRREVQKGIDLGEDWITINERLAQKGYDNTNYANLWRQQAENLDDAVAAKQAVDTIDPQTAKLIDEYDAVNRVFDDVEVRTEQWKMGDAQDATINPKTSQGYAGLPTKTKALIEDIIYARSGVKADELGANWWAGHLDEIRGTVNGTLARGFLFEAVPGLKNAAEVVAITRNTWTHPDNIPNVIAASNNTRLGKILGETAQAFEPNNTVLRQVQPELSVRTPYAEGGVRSGSIFLRDGTEVVPLFRLNADNALELAEEVSRMPGLSEPVRARILADLGEGVISTKDFRILKDLNLDQTAKLMPKQMIDVDDISKMTKKEQLKLLEAEGVRQKGFVGTFLEYQGENLFNRFAKTWQKKMDNTPMSATTFQQKRMFQEISNEASTLDIKAKNTIKGLRSSGPAGDKLRRLYFGDELVDAGFMPTREQALGAAIVGPKQEKITYLIQETDPLTGKQTGIRDTNPDGTPITVEDYILSDKQALDEWIARDEKFAADYKRELAEVPAKKEAVREKAKADKEAAREQAKNLKQRVRDTLKQRMQTELDALDEELMNLIDDMEEQGLTQKRKETRDAYRPKKKAITDKYEAQRVANLNKIDDILARELNNIDTEAQIALDSIDTSIGKSKVKAEETAARAKKTGDRPPGGQPYGTIGGKFNYDNPSVQLDLFGAAAPSVNVSRLTETGTWAMNRLFFETTEKPTFLDRITGNQNYYKNDLLNQKGRWQAAQIMDAFALRVQDQPEKFWEFFEQAAREYNELTLDPNYLRSGLRPQDIVRNIGSDGSLGALTAGQIRDIQAELSLGMYYYNEGSKIVERNLLQQVQEGVLLQSDIAVMPARMQEQFLEAFTNMPEEVLRNPQLIDEVNQLIGEMINGQVRKSVMNGSPAPTSTLLTNLSRSQANKTKPIGIIGEIFTRKPNDYTGVEQMVERWVNATTDFERQSAHQSIVSRFDHLNAKVNAGTIDGLELAELDDLFKVMRQIDNNSTVATRISEFSDTIVRQNGLANVHFTNADDLADIVDGVLGRGNEKIGEALIGKNQYRILKQQLFSSRKQGLQRKIDQILREESMGAKNARAASGLFQSIGSTFYLLVLGLRSKFYTNNFITAMPIVYSQTGQNLYKTAITGGMGVPRKIAYAHPGSAHYYQIAVVDANGRPWTYGELSEILHKGGSRNEYRMLTERMEEDMLAYVRDRKLLTPEGMGMLMDTLRRTKGVGATLTMGEDYLWRAAAMVEDLKAGKSIEEAQATARRSMLDYGDMTPAEKALSANLLVFYAFKRQNLAGFLRAFTDPKKMKRFMNLLKYDNGIERMNEAMQQAVNDDPDYKWNEEMFMSEFMANRTVLYREDVADKPTEQFYITSPALAAQDAIALFGALLQEPITTVGEELTQMTRPDIKYLMGIKGPFEHPPKRIPDNYVMGLSMIGFSDDPNDIADIMSWAVGEKITPVQSEKGVNGYIYPLTPDQSKKWVDFVMATNTVGLMAPLNEWAMIFQTDPMSDGLEGSKFETSNILERSLLSSFKVGTPQQQEIYQLYLRREALMQELRKQEAALKKTREAEQKKQANP